MMLLYINPLFMAENLGPATKPHEVHFVSFLNIAPNPTSLEDLMKLVHNRSADDALKFLKEKQPRDPSGSVGRHVGNEGLRFEKVHRIRMCWFSGGNWKQSWASILLRRSEPAFGAVLRKSKFWSHDFAGGNFGNIWNCMETRCLWMWGTNPCST